MACTSKLQNTERLLRILISTMGGEITLATRRASMASSCLSVLRLPSGTTAGNGSSRATVATSNTVPAGAENGKEGERKKRSRYEEAVERLNLLQSNALTIQKIKERREAMQLQNVPETLCCLQRLGIQPADLNALRVIHVTGTKGKGSTCAYSEAILRSAGMRTGFFSSPHMVHVRERIRIDGRPMEEERFADALFSVYDRLQRNPRVDQNTPPMPAYFKFLTVLAFEVFLREKVDVAIVEVGIGGEYDCTNVIPSPVVCGITTLDLDHTAILGERLVDIAWNKTGIFKRHAAALVSSDQTDEAVATLIRQRAEERGVSSLSVCPPLEAYGVPQGCTLQAGIDGDHQRTNVSLALQMARTWLRRERPEIESRLFSGGRDADWTSGQPFTVPREWLRAIATCHWPGRSQVLEIGHRRIFLDGAHTVKSMQGCVAWFRRAAGLDVPPPQREPRSRGLALLFHCTGDRRPETLMKELAALPFTRVLLCPPQIEPRPPASSDGANFFRPHCEQTRQSMECEAAWRRLRPDMNDARRVQRFESVTDALRELEAGPEEEDVLVSGSLILVGNVLSVLGYK